MSNILLLNDMNLLNVGSPSYESVLANINCWKRHNGTTDTRMNFTTPVTFYYKLFFYFDTAVGNTPATRLLGLDYDDLSLTGSRYGDSELEDLKFLSNLHSGIPVDNGAGTQNNVSNSAINFLLQNCEYERAEKLLHFIKLLSDISSYEPWQFQTIQGVDEALKRPYFSEGNFAIEEARKALTIKCLPEGYNSRIGTLMDLYRDICFSYYWRKEIVPDNLRKFDMGLFIFSQPVRRFHIGDNSYSYYEIPKKHQSDDADTTDNKYYSSVKYIEFQNCEFDYNSTASSYTDLNNADGKTIEPEIKIFYDSAYEMRYNEFLMRVIGDMVFQDTDFDCKSELYQTDDNVVKSRLKSKTAKPGFTDMLLNNITSTSDLNPIKKIKSTVRKLSLGNLNGASVSDVADMAREAYSGNILTTAARIESDVRPVIEDIKNEKLAPNKLDNDKSRGFVKLPYKMSEKSE